MKFTDLPVVTASTITQSHVFATSTVSATEQITLGELQKCFTGLTAPSSSSISIVGSTVPSGITVGSNGYVGIDNTNPQVALDIGDIGSATLAEVRLASRTAGRQASFSLKDSAVIWRNTKKASDTDFYIQASTDGSTFTDIVNIDTNGNFSISDGTSALTDKFFVKDGSVKFQSGTSGIMFDPGVCEMKSTVAGDILYINKSNDDDIVLGNDVLYVENGTNSYVGINTTSPAYALDVYGSGVFTRFNNTLSSTSSLLFTNTTRSAYFSLVNNNLSIGGNAGNTALNLIYDCSNRYLGLGTTSPNAKLHVKSSDEILATFQAESNAKCEILQVNTASSGPAATSSLYTFASGNVSSPSKKWSVGLYNVSPYSDALAFLIDGSTSTSAVKASLNRDGDLDIKGSLTTNSDYTHGKFVQVYETRVTGNCIYFNPFTPDSNTNPSGHNDNHAPFGITSFNGSIEKIQILTSDTDCANLTNGPRFEIVSITPTYDASIPDGFVSGFSISPPSNPSSVPISGIIGYVGLGSISPNQLITISKNQFNGTTNFQSGRLLQFRIAEQDGTKTFDVDFTVVSTISYTVV